MNILKILTALTLIIASYAFASAQVGDSIENQKNIDKIIKEKSYPGGVDEEPLKVNPELKAPYSTEHFKTIQKQVFESLTKEQGEASSKAQ